MTRCSCGRLVGLLGVNLVTCYPRGASRKRSEQLRYPMGSLGRSRVLSPCCWWPWDAWRVYMIVSKPTAINCTPPSLAEHCGQPRDFSFKHTHLPLAASSRNVFDDAPKNRLFRAPAVSKCLLRNSVAIDQGCPATESECFLMGDRIKSSCHTETRIKAYARYGAEVIHGVRLPY